MELYEKLNALENKIDKTVENGNKAVEAGERKGKERLKVLEVKVKQRELGERLKMRKVYVTFSAAVVLT